LEKGSGGRARKGTLADGCEPDRKRYMRTEGMTLIPGKKKDSAECELSRGENKTKAGWGTMSRQLQRVTLRVAGVRTKGDQGRRAKTWETRTLNR